MVASVSAKPGDDNKRQAKKSRFSGFIIQPHTSLDYQPVAKGFPPFSVHEKEKIIVFFPLKIREFSRLRFRNTPLYHSCCRKTAFLFCACSFRSFFILIIRPTLGISRYSAGYRHFSGKSAPRRKSFADSSRKYLRTRVSGVHFLGWLRELRASPRLCP